MRQIVIREDEVIGIPVQASADLFPGLNYVAEHIKAAAVQLRDFQFGVGRIVFDQQDTQLDAAHIFAGVTRHYWAPAVNCAAGFASGY